MTTATRQRRKKVAPKQRKKAPNNKQLAVRIKKLEHSEELKYDDTYDATSWDGATTVVQLTGIAQGDDVNQRVGEEIIAKYANIKFRNVRVGGSTTYANYRVILFWDMQANVGAPTLLASTNAGLGLLDDTTVSDRFVAPLNYRTKQRYHVLWDKTYELNPTGGSAVPTARTIKKNFNLGGAKVKYSSSSAGDQTSRALYLYRSSSDTSSPTSDRLMTRIWYTDA